MREVESPSCVERSGAEPTRGPSLIEVGCCCSTQIRRDVQYSTLTASTKCDFHDIVRFYKEPDVSYCSPDQVIDPRSFHYFHSTSKIMAATHF